MRQGTRQRILAVAEELLLTRGFHGFSYHHIAEQLGIRNAAVHYYFPSKTDLGFALIRRYHEHFRWWAQQLRGQRLAPSAALEQFFVVERRYLEERRVCPLGVATVEFEGISDEMRAEAHALMEAVVSWLADTLRAGARSGEISYRGEPYAAALTVLAALQGALQLARLGGAVQFDRVVEQIRAEMGMTPGRLRVAG